MTSPQSIPEQLIAFSNRDKFSYNAWHDRGLNPSSEACCLKLTALFNDCADALIEAVHKGASDRQLKQILKQQLSYFEKSDYDTEEREFIGDLFSELAKILKISFNDQLNQWMYGWVLSTMLKLSSKLRSEHVLETIMQHCDGCGDAMETFIMQKEESIPEFGWSIVQCNNCKEFSMVSLGPGIKSMSHPNYKMVEQLPKADFTKEQAEIRLEQVRYFRKK